MDVLSTPADHPTDLDAASAQAETSTNNDPKECITPAASETTDAVSSLAENNKDEAGDTEVIDAVDNVNSAGDNRTLENSAPEEIADSAKPNEESCPALENQNDKHTSDTSKDLSDNSVSDATFKTCESSNSNEDDISLIDKETIVTNTPAAAPSEEDNLVNHDEEKTEVHSTDKSVTVEKDVLSAQLEKEPTLEPEPADEAKSKKETSVQDSSVESEPVTDLVEKSEVQPVLEIQPESEVQTESEKKPTSETKSQLELETKNQLESENKPESEDQQQEIPSEKSPALAEEEKSEETTETVTEALQENQTIENDEALQENKKIQNDETPTTTEPVEDTSEIEPEKMDCSSTPEETSHPISESELNEKEREGDSEEIEKNVTVIDPSHDEKSENTTKEDEKAEDNDLPTTESKSGSEPSLLETEDNEKSQLESDPNNEDITEQEETQPVINDTLSEADDQSMDQDMQQENPVFVHVSTKSVGDTEGDKTMNSDVDMQNETGDESLEATSIAEEDPIGISHDSEKDELMDFAEENSDKEQLKVVDFNETITSDKTVEDELVASKGADEELCIIPDTEREISQEEKDAATAAAAAAAEAPRNKDDSEVAKDKPRESNETETEAPAVTADSATETVSTETSNKTTAEGSFRATISVVNHAPQVNNEVISRIEELKVTKIPDADATEQSCHQCCQARKCLYKVEIQEKVTYLCSETCLISFRTLNKPQPEASQIRSELKLKDIAKNLPTSTESVKTFVRKCAECSQKIQLLDDKTLSWETMDFCNEDCLSKYQNRIGSHCANCKKCVLISSLGKYCVRFGHDIRQFCCSLCLEEFKKGLKVCSYCQKDISGGSEGFLAPVGDKGQFKDFCTQLCMEKYDQMSNKNSNKKSTMPQDIGQCSVCNNEKPVLVQFDQMDRTHKFCSEPCFVAFKFVNNAEPIQCDMCKKYFEKLNSAEFSIFYDNIVKNFCCKTCQNIYIIANRRIVPCRWCKVKKYNFDMIKKVCNTGQVLMMCSLNCLSLFQVSINAVSSKKIKCDHCSKMYQAQYHLTMSDATIRNFCTYHCVMSFQNQFAKLPITLSDKTVLTNKTQIPVVPAGGPKPYQNRSARNVNENVSVANVNEVQMPVITNVQSLANTTNGPTSVTRSAAVKINNQQPMPQAPASPKPQIKQQVIVKPPPMPQMRNAATWCKPILHTKGVSCRPHPCNKETQTDEIKEKTIFVPVPVPIYVPAPMHMFSAPVPVPIPFPLPIPVPIFIPTTRNSAAGIMKEIKKIQVKIPTDPFEAELLMMAEMVAGEKKVDNTDSESEEDDNAGDAADGGFSPEAVDTSNTFGDDMLQMALKMATELDEPAVDLEGALTANTITASQNQEAAVAVVATEETVDDPQPMHQLIDRQTGQAIRGRKRTNRQPRSINPAKRGRRMSSHVEMPLLPPQQPSQPPEPIEKPDANMCLKYTFGVNAWKQWVTTKNAELEKSSRRVKLFKNEILQLTADELNYSLCLFVKEVRKPNGTEYAPDTIYYLCLGIQQYLFENGRIDNIFTDAYYEKFTDCLDEVARKFSVLYNDSHYIVTRVEEEHLWESKQLGAHSPHVLLSTLMFFNTKHFNLTTVDEHMQLSFSHIMKHWKRNPNQPGAAKIPGSRNVLLRFYPPQTTLDANSRKKKVYEQQENEDNPLRCPVKLYEFYLSKCPESVKTRNDVFYLLPERSCVPDSPVWYSTMALGREALEKMLHRVKMVKEINVALLTMD